MTKLSQLYLTLLVSISGCAASPGPVSSPRVTASAVAPTPVVSSAASPSGTRQTQSGAPASGGTGGASGSLPAADPETLSSLPGTREVSGLQVPDSFPEDAVVRGQTLYTTYCAPCHGANGQGVTGTPPLVNPRRFRYGSQNRQVLRTILYGIPRTAMGKYSKMTTQQGLDLVAYVRSLQK